MVALLLAAALLATPAKPLSLPELVDQTALSTVLIVLPPPDSDPNADTHVCAGVVVSASKGWVLTARHCVVEGDNRVFIDHQSVSIVRLSDTLALLSTPPMTRPPLELRRKRPELGEALLSLGHAFGPLTAFIRHVAAYEEGELVLDGPLAPGMSGGPVVDMDGRLVGINQMTSWVVGIASTVDEIRKFLGSQK